MNKNEVVQADAIALPIEDKYCQTCVTSPPYWGLRSYADAKPTQFSDALCIFGTEETPTQYVNHMVEIGKEIRRVLKDDGTWWLNIGDSYILGHTVLDNDHERGSKGRTLNKQTTPPEDIMNAANRNIIPGLKTKDLAMIPNRVAIALQDAGWYIRSEIIWNKPNVMPESVEDRPICTHEKIWLLTKNSHYYFDHEAIMEQGVSGQKRYPRNVWNIPNTVLRQRNHKRHTATFPIELAERCILASTHAGDVVLDPFAGTGTTGVAARKHNRNYILSDISDIYLGIIRERLEGELPTSTDSTQKYLWEMAD